MYSKPILFCKIYSPAVQFAATVDVFRVRLNTSLLWKPCLKFILSCGDFWMNNGIKNLKICMLIYFNKFDTLCITFSLFSSRTLFLGYLKFYWRRALWNTNFLSLMDCISRNNARLVFPNLLHHPLLVRS